MSDLETYFRDHAICPQCRTNKWGKTLAGMGKDKDGNLYDRNEVRCACGWTGIVHDLIPRGDL